MPRENEREVEVIVRVRVNVGHDPEEVAVEMVKDALATRAGHWQRKTFVSEGDVHVGGGLVAPPRLEVDRKDTDG